MPFPTARGMDSTFWGNYMNLRHLRCFIAVAEELHFGRAARRLHVEQSPLSRTIRQLEADLGVTLLERTSRGVRLTPAGQVFLEEARRVLLAFEQAQTKARAVAAGHRGTLRIALAGGVGRTRLSALLALCREEAPEVGIRLFEAPLSQVVGGLGNDLYDAAFAMAGEMEAGVVAMPVWQDPLVVAIPARHPCWRTSGCRWKRWWATRWCCATRRCVRSAAGNASACCAWWSHRRSWPST